MWLEMTEPTLDNLHAAIDHHLIRGVSYRYLVGATRYGSLLLLDSPEDPLPLSEIVVRNNDMQVRIWWGAMSAEPSHGLAFLKASHESIRTGYAGSFDLFLCGTG